MLWSFIQQFFKLSNSGYNLYKRSVLTLGINKLSFTWRCDKISANRFPCITVEANGTLRSGSLDQKYVQDGNLWYSINVFIPKKPINSLQSIGFALDDFCVIYKLDWYRMLSIISVSRYFKHISIGLVQSVKWSEIGCSGAVNSPALVAFFDFFFQCLFWLYWLFSILDHLIKYWSYDHLY